MNEWFIGILLVYVLIGLFFSLKAERDRRKAKMTDTGLNPIFFLAGPFYDWLLFLLWPLWLTILLIDRKAAVAKSTTPECTTEALVGKDGEVVLELRPIGRVRVDGKLYDATSPQGALTIGTTIIVTGRTLGELTVERANASKA